MASKSGDDGDEQERSPSKMSPPERKEIPGDGGSNHEVPHGVSGSHPMRRMNDVSQEKERACPVLG